MKNKVVSVLKKLKEKDQFSDRKYKYLHLLVLDQAFYMFVQKYISLLRMVFYLFVLFYQILVTPTYKIAKIFVPLLAALTSNEYTIKDSFSFSEEPLKFDFNLVMT